MNDYIPVIVCLFCGNQVPLYGRTEKEFKQHKQDCQWVKNTREQLVVESNLNIHKEEQ